MTTIRLMNIQRYQMIYHQMPEKFRKHGSMPTQIELSDDVESFFMNGDEEQVNQLIKQSQLI